MAEPLIPLKPPSTPYLTVIEGRTPKQKIHTSLGAAKNAFSTPRKNSHQLERPNMYGDRNIVETYSHGWGQLYKHDGSDWVLIETVPEPTQADMITEKRGTWTAHSFETRPWILNKED